MVEPSPGILMVPGSNPTQSIALKLIYGNVKGSLRIIEINRMEPHETTRFFFAMTLKHNIKHALCVAKP